MELNKNIPQGYKGSPLGIIPQEWEVKRLGEITTVNQGLQIPISDRLKVATENCLKYITIQYLNGAKEEEFISNPSKSVICNKEDILMTRTGNTGIVVSDVEGVFHNNFFKIKYRKEALNKKYFIEFLNSKRTQHTLIVKAGTSTIPDLNHKDFYSIYTLLPPLPEQQKIAEILTCWDAVIEKQIQLIDKLETRKRGLMQQLLTGKKRLKGFEGKWRTVKLGEVGEISSAGIDKKSIEGELPIRLLNYLDVYRRDFLFSKEFNHWVTASAEKIEKCSVKKGDIFFTPSSEVPNDIGISAIAMEDMPDVVYSYHVVRLRLHEDWDLKFRAYAFQTDMFYKQAETWCDGSGQRYVISQNNFRKIKINVPLISEQTAIANILSAADEEIGKEKEKLAALKEQKRGLMQVLLTGKKRVKI